VASGPSKAMRRARGSTSYRVVHEAFNDGIFRNFKVRQSQD